MNRFVALFPLVVAACVTPVNVTLIEQPFFVRTEAGPANAPTCSARRARAAQHFEDAILVFGAGAEEGRFQPNDDFYWLTAVSSPDAVLVLQAAGGRLVLERLYLHPKDERHERWNGPRLAPGAEAAALSGIRDSRPLERLEADMTALVSGEESVLASGEEVTRFLTSLGIEGAPLSLRPLQVVKDQAEIRAVRAAVDITQAALTEGIRAARPGSHEFVVEAAIEGGFRKRGAEAVAFPSICGSGPNTCYLHYRANEREIQDGDLVLMDVGAKFRHYCADVTRTIPANGTFTDRQREVYSIVFQASREAARVLRPGATLQQAHEVAAGVFDGHGYGRYFLHGIGHGLGLEVHDAPARDQVLAPGMVVTIEPGLYIPDEEIGIRIEDDYLITASGAELLSRAIPSHPDDLEAFLATLRDVTPASDLDSLPQGLRPMR